MSGIVCIHCGYGRVRFVRHMTNTDKFTCPKCGKNTIVGRDNSPIIRRRHHPRRIPGQNLDCEGNLMTDGKIRFTAFNHQHKADKFLEALKENNYKQLDCTNGFGGIRFVLTDTDILGRRVRLEKIRAHGVQHFFVYPHAARPDLVNDIYKEWAFTTAHFVSAPGHVDVMRRFGYSRPLEVVGWSLCPIKKFSPRPEPRKVLFAPIHPRCSVDDQRVNRAAFQKLEKLARADKIELTVRFINSLPGSGLNRIEHPNIIYTNGAMNQSYTQIDEADIVVAHQSFLYLAVARGVPSISMATDLPTHVQMRRKPVVWARNWKKYEHLIAFPYDILQVKDRDLFDVMGEIVQCDEKVLDWKRRMIGSPFNKKRFVQKLEKYL